MKKDEKEAIAALTARLERIEVAVSNHIGDHTAWLLALQAIVAVFLVRHLAAANDPKAFMSQCEEWAKNIVRTTQPAPTIPSETSEKIQEIALEKVENFFKGISIKS